MEHLPNSNTIQKIFSIKIIANERTLAHIDQQFIEDAISNEFANSFLTVDNWEIQEIFDQNNKTFKDTEQSEAKTNFFNPSDCCIFSDPRKWKEELNLLYEIFDIEDLAVWLHVSESVVENWHDNIECPNIKQEERIHKIYEKSKDITNNIFIERNKE